jgi:hypothetical protein
MIVCAISLLLVIILLGGAYLLSASSDVSPSASDEVTTAFHLQRRTYQGRSPLLLAARKLSEVAEESSRITSSSFRALRERPRRLSENGNA